MGFCWFLLLLLLFGWLVWYGLVCWLVVWLFGWFGLVCVCVCVLQVFMLFSTCGQQLCLEVVGTFQLCFKIQSFVSLELHQVCQAILPESSKDLLSLPLQSTPPHNFYINFKDPNPHPLACEASILSTKISHNFHVNS